MPVNATLVTSAGGRAFHLPAAMLGAASAAAAILVAAALDLPLRDPDNAAGPLYLRLSVIMFAMAALDVLPRAFSRSRRTGHPFGLLVRSVIAERWSRPRATLVLIGLVSFYLSYVGYRNLKGFLPFATDGMIADDALLTSDLALGGGVAPATHLHELLGTGIAAEVLALVYVSFLVFVPLSLAVALVWSRDLRSGYLYVTVLCLNWVLGAISYYMVPSLGPVFYEAGMFAHLPATPVSDLQSMLASDRESVLADPYGSDRLAGIAGFASLHVAIVFSAAIVAHLLGFSRWICAALWVFLVLTVIATIYFGWHYVVDDIAGFAIGGLAVWLSVKAMGQPALDRERKRRTHALAPARS